MTNIDNKYSVKISDTNTLHIARTEEEIKEISKFNAIVHQDQSIEQFLNRVYLEHPRKKDIYWFYIKNNDTSQIISSMVLLPMIWKLAGEKIKVAEMGFVGTLESFRGQDLFGVVNIYYEKILKEQDYILSVIRGIPNFYRKYGYEFSLPLNGGYLLPTANIPSNPDEDIKIRKATEKDLDFIQKQYEANFDNLCVSTQFEPKSFSFRMLSTTSDEFNSMTYIIEQNRKSTGFFTIGCLHNSDRAEMLMASQLTKNQMIKVLNFVKSYNTVSTNNFVVNAHENSNFGNFVLNLGAIEVKPWGWQIKIVRLSRFLNSIKKLLERRIKESMFIGLTRDVKISDYKSIITISFVDGKIKNIESEIKYPDGNCDLRIPRSMMMKLFLSERTIDEINYIITDVIIKKDSELLISILFPKMISLPYSWY